MRIASASLSASAVSRESSLSTFQTIQSTCECRQQYDAKAHLNPYDNGPTASEIEVFSLTCIKLQFVGVVKYLNKPVDCSADAWSIPTATATLETQLRKQIPYELSSRLTQRGSTQFRNTHRRHSTTQYRAPRIPVGSGCRLLYFSHHSAAVFTASTHSGCFSAHSSHTFSFNQNKSHARAICQFALVAPSQQQRSAHSEPSSGPVAKQLMWSVSLE